MEIDINTIQARLVSDTGEEAGPPLDLPINVDVKQLELICNALLKNVRNENAIKNKSNLLLLTTCRMSKHPISSSLRKTKSKAL